MDKPGEAATPGWLVMVAQLPTEDPASRMRVLRTLESLGAAVIREGAYLLPDTAANRQSLESLTEYVSRTAGASQVLHVSSASPARFTSIRPTGAPRGRRPRDAASLEE